MTGPPPEAAWTGRARALAVALPAAAACLVYLGTLRAGFVHDDNLQIVRNPWVHELAELPTIVSRPVWGFRTDDPSPYWRPLQMGLYNLLWAIGGGRPLPFHLLNVVLHGAVTALLALLVLALSRNAPTAGGAALLFAAHPVHTEVVAWIASLPELLFSAALLGALLLHRRRQGASGRRRRLLLAGALLSFAAALLSKETALIFLPLVFLLELWNDGGASGERIRRAGAALLPYLPVAALYLAARAAVIGGPIRGGQATPTDALLNAPWLFWSYIGKILVPAHLVAVHPIDPVTSAAAPSFLLGAAGGLALAGALAALARHRPDLAFAGSLAVLPLLPALWLPALRSAWLAERYAYLPSAGIVWVLIAAVAASARHASRVLAAGVATVVVASALALPAAVRTVARNAEWRDDEHLALATLRDEPRAELMYVVLGNWYQDRGRPQEALAVYERGAAAVPGSVPLAANRINLALSLGRMTPDRAVDELERLEGSDPHLYELQVVLGDAYLGARRFPKAKAAYRRAIAMNPLDANVHNRLAVAHMLTGKLEQARSELLRALEIDPGLAAARENLERLTRRTPTLGPGADAPATGRPPEP